MKTQTSAGRFSAGKLIRKVGIWGFLFFLIKGLAWIAIGLWGASKL